MKILLLFVAFVSVLSARGQLYERFVSPPAGYGEVPFYWWQGDTLTHERLLWHLDMLQEKRVASLQINYSHTDDRQGYFWGSSLKSQPAQFSDEWWELLRWFTDEAARRGMTVSVSDYTLGLGQGYALDEVVREHPDIIAQELKFVRVGEPCEGQLLSVAAVGGDSIATYAVPQPRSFNPMHPLSGSEYVRCFFQRFEDKLGGGNLNFFFSDELNFNIHGFAWDDRFADEFMRRKGYDIRPLLPALAMDMGQQTVQVRLDYNDVFTALSEENFFIPVYRWHAERGLTYGCDHGGRGRQVDEFGDYFRTQRWNQAPGSDQPNLERDVVKAKVAASIAHLYRRPRVWLEGFYGSGWGTTSAQLSDAIYANYAMGYNLLSLHGLYYATPDSRWEWAPPCNHFRMPYWQTMDRTLEATERLSYLLSQGRHCCDVGLLYPVEPKVAGYGNRAVDIAFATGEALYHRGIDFDFIDYSSLLKATADNQGLHIADECYRAIVVPDMEVMHPESRQKLEEFASQGGLVFNIQSGEQVDSLITWLDHGFCRDFRLLAQGGTPYIQHREIEGRNLYAVYNVERGASCLFRAKGEVELWDALSGSRYRLTDVKQTAEGTIVKMPMERTAMQLIFFCDKSDAPRWQSGASSHRIELADEWRSEIVPVLDNRYGDFYLPATPTLLQPEVRHFHYRASHESDIDLQGNGEWSEVTYTYGEELMCSGATNDLMDDATLAAMTQAPQGWQPYTFSRRWGVLGDAGHQGYHGLKGIDNPEVVRLGRLQRTDTGTRRVAEPEGNNYYLFTHAIAPHDGEYEICTGGGNYARCFVGGQRLVPGQTKVWLRKGANRVVICYEGPTISYLYFKKAGVEPGQSEYLPFDPYGDSAPRYGWYSFQSAPGLQGFAVGTAGKLKAWVDGRPVKVKSKGGQNVVTLHDTQPRPVNVVMCVELPLGSKGGSGITTALVQHTGPGIMHSGDWGATEGLRNYSGAVRYTQTFTLPDTEGKRVTLCIGELSSSARLTVNGHEAGARIHPDWRFDITDYIRSGENNIELTIYNTAANHYETVPTAYVRHTPSGILGKAWVEW